MSPPGPSCLPLLRLPSPWAASWFLGVALQQACASAAEGEWRLRAGVGFAAGVVPAALVAAVATPSPQLQPWVPRWWHCRPII